MFFHCKYLGIYIMNISTNFHHHWIRDQKVIGFGIFSSNVVQKSCKKLKPLQKYSGTHLKIDGYHNLNISINFQPYPAVICVIGDKKQHHCKNIHSCAI